MNGLKLFFRSLKATNFCLFNPHLTFFRHGISPKRNQIAIFWKSNRKSYVFCRMALFLVTWMTLTAETASGFYYWFKPSYFRKYSTDLRQIFRFGQVMGTDDRCEMGCNHSRDIAMATNFCAFNHDVLGRRKCNTRGRPSTISVDNTSTPRNGH